MPYTDAIALAAANPDVAFRFMWQLVEDGRRLHNQTAILGRGNAAERISTMLVDINEKRTTRRYRDGRIDIRHSRNDHLHREMLAALTDLAVTAV